MIALIVLFLVFRPVTRLLRVFFRFTGKIVLAAVLINVFQSLFAPRGHMRRYF